jgi:GNAT superfamily N-acetyltransferase
MVDRRWFQLPPAGADERWALLDGGIERARCGLWWDQPAPRSGERFGSLGQLQADGADASARLALLRHGCERLRLHGCRRVLAPMDGSSWHDYRLVEAALPTDPREFPFAGEPSCAADWIAPLQAAGFSVQARYVSSICTDLAWRRPRRSGHPNGAGEGLVIRSAAGVEAAALLPQLHGLVMAGFRRQPLFSPVDQAAFAALWQPWQRLLDPELSLLAFNADRLVGVLLAHPDRPAATSRLVVRTLVVAPGRLHAGLGRELLETVHARAAARGFGAVIHALMHCPGPSIALSAPYARVFRRYLLMGRQLGEAGENG